MTSKMDLILAHMKNHTDKDYTAQDVKKEVSTTLKESNIERRFREAANRGEVINVGRTTLDGRKVSAYKYNVEYGKTPAVAPVITQTQFLF